MMNLLEKLSKETDFFELNKICREGLIGHLGISLVKVDGNGLWGEMIVSEKIKRPFGGLHGGATAAFAESLGSVLSFLLIEKEENLYGVELNINHLKSAGLGEKVTGCATPLHLGKRSHVHEIKFYNEKNDLMAVSRLTTLIVIKA